MFRHEAPRKKTSRADLLFLKCLLSWPECGLSVRICAGHFCPSGLILVSEPSVSRVSCVFSSFAVFYYYSPVYDPLCFLSPARLLPVLSPCWITSWIRPFCRPGSVNTSNPCLNLCLVDLSYGLGFVSLSYPCRYQCSWDCLLLPDSRMGYVTALISPFCTVAPCGRLPCVATAPDYLATVFSACVQSQFLCFKLWKIIFIKVIDDGEFIHLYWPLLLQEIHSYLQHNSTITKVSEHLCRSKDSSHHCPFVLLLLFLWISVLPQQRLFM